MLLVSMAPTINTGTLARLREHAQPGVSMTPIIAGLMNRQAK